MPPYSVKTPLPNPPAFDVECLATGLTLFEITNGEVLTNLFSCHLPYSHVSYKSLARSLFVVSLFGLAACSPEPPKEPVAEPAQDSAMTPAAENTAETLTETMVEPTAETRDPKWREQLTKPTLMTFEADKSYFWDLKTNMGDMRFRLFHETAPMHATSTIYLTEIGFYDDLTFHRVIPGFMAQGGDPTGTGSGDPGYRYDGEFAGNLSHDRPGLLSMANAGPGTDGSQFFITFVATPFLDSKHTLFGELVSGMDTLKTLEGRGSRSGATQERLEIMTASISKE
jgi:peptidylprolyl isomerase